MAKEKLVKVRGCVKVSVVKIVAVGEAGGPAGQADMARTEEGRTQRPGYELGGKSGRIGRSKEFPN